MEDSLFFQVQMWQDLNIKKNSNWADVQFFHVNK